MPANLIQSRYDKPFLTIEQQIDLLHRRGMKIENRNRASLYLQRIGYYYLSGYMYPFRVFEDTNDAEPDRHRGDHFAPGTTFDHVISLYVFDKKLKLLVIDAIERIELALRVDIAYLAWRQRSIRALQIRVCTRSGINTWRSKRSKPARDMVPTARSSGSGIFRSVCGPCAKKVWASTSHLDRCRTLESGGSLAFL